MIKNKPENENSHDRNAKRGLSVKRDMRSDVKSDKYVVSPGDKKPFKGVRKEALDKLTPTLNKLAKYDKQ